MQRSRLRKTVSQRVMSSESIDKSKMPHTHFTFKSFFKTVNRKEEKNSTIAWTAHLTAKFKVLRELLHRHHRGENRKGHSILANQGKLKTDISMAIPVGPFWEHPWEPQEAVTQALYECISVQVKPWPQSWGKLKAGMVRKVQLQPIWQVESSTFSDGSAALKPNSILLHMKVDIWHMVPFICEPLGRPPSARIESTRSWNNSTGTSTEDSN